jgi:SET domain-containing protein
MRRRFLPQDFRLKVKKSSTGRGLFADERIPKGACVIEYIGRPATPAQMKANRGKYLFWTSSKTMIDGNISANTARFINHSCVPNCEIDIKNKRIYVFALRSIKPGDELHYDYGEEYFEMHLAHDCRCPKCEKRRKLS